MNLIKLPKLDHSAKTLGEVFGLSDYESNYVKSAIVFEVISTTILAKELFSDPNDAPDDMTTLSGIFQRAFAHAKTPEQQYLLMMEFRSGYNRMMGELNSFEEVPTVPKDILEKDKMGIANILAQLVGKLKSLPIQHTIEKIKECNHDFDKFIEIVLPRSDYDENGNSSKDSAKNIDDMIRDSLKNISGLDIQFGSSDDEDNDDED